MKIVLIQLVLIPVLFVIADVAIGLATGYDAENTRARFAAIVESMQSGVPDPGRVVATERIKKADLRLHPYTGFGPRGLNESHNNEFRLAKSEPLENEYRIMILGGSVAAGFGNRGSGGIVEVRRVLKEDPRFKDRVIRFLGQGFGSYKQPQQLFLASYLLGSGVVPHAIISLDGFNEVALSQQNGEAGMSPNYPAFSQWVHLTNKWGENGDSMLDALMKIRDARERGLAITGTAERYGLHHSSLIGPRVIGRLQHEKRQFSKAASEYIGLLRNADGFGPLAGPNFSKKHKRIAENAVRMWKESTRALNSICKDRGIFFMNVLQPTLHDEGSKVLTESEVVTSVALDSWVRGAKLGYPLLRRAGRELAEEGLAYFDASLAFKDVEATLYYDPCHFNQLGYQVLGIRIGERFLEALPEGELPK